MTASGAEQREVYYSGRVQGVGFRYTVRSLASRMAVTGFVKNLPDGRVHLVVEGSPGRNRRASGGKSAWKWAGTSAAWRSRPGLPRGRFKTLRGPLLRGLPWPGGGMVRNWFCRGRGEPAGGRKRKASGTIGFETDFLFVHPRER